LLLGLSLEELVVNGEDVVGVTSLNTDGEEGVNNLDERGGDNTHGSHFEFVEDVFSTVDGNDSLIDPGSSGLVFSDLGSSGGSQVVELLVVDGEGLGSEVTEVAGSGLFVLSEVELGLGCVPGVLGIIDFVLSEFVFFSEFFSLLGVQGEVLVVFVLDLANQVVKEFVELVVDLEVVGLEEVNEVSEGDGLLSLGAFDGSGINLEWLGLLEGGSLG